jgi:hypothetical protein
MGAVNARGTCLCGGVEFEVTEPFASLSYCHCTTCKRISGGPGTANARVRTGAIRIVRGRELLRTFQPQEGSAKTFCSRCGSNLFGGGWPDSEEASVRLTALESPLEGKPEAHTFVRSVASWETLPDDGLARFETRATS